MRRRRRVLWWAALLGLGALALWWRLASVPPPSITGPFLVRFHMAADTLGVVLLDDYAALGEGLEGADSVCVRNAGGEVLFDGLWAELQRAVVDTLPLTQALGLPASDP